MEANRISGSFKKHQHYCESEDFKGWDPYDGLNSQLFRITPLKHWDKARLAWIQLFKRNPLNLRRLSLVPKGHNAKGIGLFLSGYCNLYKIAESDDTTFGNTNDLLNRINELASLLIQIKTEGYSGACWGYNFDWQARGGLFFPAGTPTVVATTFAAYGLLDAYDVTGDKKYLEVAISSAKFVINDLKRTEKADGGFLFSYSPLPGNVTVYNASLLGSKLLARIYHYTKDSSLLAPAAGSVKACVNAQHVDGSWIYGELDVQNWIDSFHTGFNLESLYDFTKYTGNTEAKTSIEQGLNFYLNNFFLSDGTPKYYHNKTYPIDIHCPAQLMVTLSRLNVWDKNFDLANRVLNWTIMNMQSGKGYFYYQLKQGISSKIPFMRWSQAWMFYAMSFYLIEQKKLK